MEVVVIYRVAVFWRYPLPPALSPNSRARSFLYAGIVWCMKDGDEIRVASKWCNTWWSYRIGLKNSLIGGKATPNTTCRLLKVPYLANNRRSSLISSLAYFIRNRFEVGGSTFPAASLRHYRYDGFERFAVELE